MDGYAVAAGDERETYRVLEVVGAGSTPTARLGPGAAVKVMTGAAVPAGTGRVIKVEDVQGEGEFIRVLHRQRDPNVCAQGEDVRRGDVVLRRATRIAPIDVANLIGCGITEVEVYRRVRAAIFATGDEIVDDPRDLQPGKIMNSNGPLMAGLARQYGLDVVREARLGDDPGATAAALRAGLDEAEVVVFSGGVSVGDFDFVGRALEGEGMRVHFDSVAVKPGRPTTFASRQVGNSAGDPKAGNSPHVVFGLPGNPVSVYMGFHVFVLRAAARLMQSDLLTRELTLPLGFDFHRRKASRTEYVPCRLGEDGRLGPVEFHGSAHLTAMSGADGFFIVSAGVQDVKAGEPVRFMALGGVFS